jgi:hypothetical protein
MNASYLFHSSSLDEEVGEEAGGTSKDGATGKV